MRLGIAIAGIRGAIGSTVMAVLSRAIEDKDFAGFMFPAGRHADHLVPYHGLAFHGWDVEVCDAATAIRRAGIFDELELAKLAPLLPAHQVGAAITPATLAGGEPRGALLAEADRIAAELAAFKRRERLSGVVVVDLLPTRPTDPRTLAAIATPGFFDRSDGWTDLRLTPSIAYAYAAIRAGCPFVNFTPNYSTDLPSIIQYARDRGVAIAGKDGRTGQTFIKSLLAEGLRARGLTVEGWVSMNILGNSDGANLAHAENVGEKLSTKREILDQILGYKVEDHLVDIKYYRPRGDNKESWDNIDLRGVGGKSMQMKINFLCRDSILAAPLIIELARLIDLAQRRNSAGPQDQLAAFFKSPRAAAGDRLVPGGFMTQHFALLDWLDA
jgi:myo-inositol-1-phosphate synthase